MQGINPADVAAGVLIAAFFLGVLLWGFRTTEQPAGRFFAICFFLMSAGLVWWRIGCWTGHLTCGLDSNSAARIAETEICWSEPSVIDGATIRQQIPCPAPSE